MSLDYLADLESGQYSFPLADFHGGDYTLAGNFQAAFNQYDVSVVSFVDIGTYVDAANIGELAWIAKLRNIAAAHGISDGTLILCVLYKNVANVSNPLIEYPTAMTRAGFPNYNDSGDSAQYIHFFLQKNDVWASSAANIFRAQMASTSGAFTYILKKTAPDTFRVTDKIHLSAPGSSNGDPGERIDFSGWAPDYAALASFVSRRIQDHLDAAPAVSLPSPPPKLRSGAELRLEFPMKAIGAAGQARYIFKDSGIPVDVIASTLHADVTVQQYLSGASLESAVLTLADLGTYDAHNLTFELDGSLIAVSGLPFSISPAPSFEVDATPPAIDAAHCVLDFVARTVTVKFTEGVYANADGTGDLVDANFATPVIYSASATISNVSLASHTAGSDTAVFGFSASGTPDGSEYISIAPAGLNPIYDVAGNPMAAAETMGNLYLPDLKAPAVPAPVWDTPADDNTPTISWAGDPAVVEYELTVRDTASNLILAETPPAGSTSYTFLAAQALADGSYTVYLRARDNAAPTPNWSASGSVDLAIDTSSPPALPRDIILALDYSGSMNSPISFDGTTKTKKEWIQDAANDFFNYLLNDIASDDYKLGVVSYATKAMQALGLTDKATLEANHTLFSQALASLPQGSTTAMGKAMAHSLSMLGHSASDAAFGASRAIVLMADGQQNVNPKVVFSGGTTPTSLTIDTNQAPADCPVGMGIVTVDDGTIPVHTFGIGGNVPWLDDLADLSQVTSGTAGADGDIWPAAFNYLVGISSQLFPYSSPQIVRNEVASFRKGERREFPINAGIAKLTVCLNWVGASPLRCSLYQGRVRVQFDSITEKDGLYIGTVKFPHIQLVGRAGVEPRYASKRQARTQLGFAGATRFESPLYEVKGKKPRPGIDVPEALRQIVQPRGTWTLVVEGVPGHTQPPDGYPFNLSVIVDEKRIKYSLRPFKRVVQPRESLELGIGFFRDGVPLAAAATAKTTITRPLLDFSAALALDPAAVKKALSAAAAAGIDIKDDTMRTQVLARDPAIAKLLARRVDSRLTLGSPLFAMLGVRSARGEGIRKRFADTPTQGAYRIEHLVSIDLGKEGVYERIVRDWLFVKA